MNAKQSLGNWGEHLASEFLKAKGYQILDTNYRTPHGELDLVAVQPGSSVNSKDCLVFVEVRTRASRIFGAPELSITPSKQEHVRLSVANYIEAHFEKVQSFVWRIDVIAIRRLNRHAPAEITHFENAFS